MFTEADARMFCGSLFFLVIELTAKISHDDYVIDYVGFGALVYNLQHRADITLFCLRSGKERKGRVFI